MYNYNRDVAQAEQERMERMVTAAQRQVPHRMRRDGFTQATGWLAQKFGRPLRFGRPIRLGHRAGCPFITGGPPPGGWVWY